VASPAPEGSGWAGRCPAPGPSPDPGTRTRPEARSGDS
jgi:hypothetical protein